MKISSFGKILLRFRYLHLYIVGKSQVNVFVCNLTNTWDEREICDNNCDDKEVEIAEVLTILTVLLTVLLKDLRISLNTCQLIVNEIFFYFS